MKKYFFLLTLVVLLSPTMKAQRHTDRLDRGLVAIPDGNTGSSTSNMVTWRRLANEYFGVTYNLYKNGSLLAQGLTTTCYSDNSNAPAGTQYQVAAVVNGVEQPRSTAMRPWSQYVYKLVARCSTGYIDLPLATIKDGSGNDITSHYEPNDAEFADLDGDGQLEMIIKRLNTVDSGSNFAYGTAEHDRIDAYDINWQTGETKLLWWIDVGPNMVSGGSHELNIIAYDWDEDGKAEVVLRGADDMMVWWARGGSRTPYPYRVGQKGVNTRNSVTHTANMTYTNTGAEYLIYMNGDTGQPYWVKDYPLARESAGAWGDNYGHRSSKYFFGAPVFNGTKASLFLARGIYTRHKMIAYDINPSTHELTLRWQWSNNGGWSDPWYGNGNHNYCIADVDEDGRDEIVYGSMVIDDTGKGLSTTGLGHGDALHCSDFDPYREGLEIFACNEEEPCMNYRNATTSQLYVRRTSSNDDGRALCGNFSNTYPGACGRSTQTGMISCVANKDIADYGGDSFIAWGDLNFRIYWDGDLLSEVLNSPGTAKEAKIEKPGTGRLFTSSGCNMNNWTKNHPCFQGDLIGDWREEIVLRHGTGVRIYASGMHTNYSMPSLWFDHEYRQAMVWQMHAYNQPPHLSYFMGELEGFTTAPPPLTLTDRTVVYNGSTISSDLNGKDLQTFGYSNNSYSVSGNVSPRLLVMNVPVWTQGNNNNSNIVTTSYTHTLNFTTGDATFSGGMNFVKQGKGTLNISKKTLNHTGRTEIWAGSVNFDGTLTSSPVFMNRFTTLTSNGGVFNGGIEMLYASTLIPGGTNKVGAISTSTLNLKYGSRVKIDINSDMSCDQLNLSKLVIDKKSGTNWTSYGPRYLAPVFEFSVHGSLPEGLYYLGSLSSVEGSLNDIVVEGLGGYSYSLANKQGGLWLKIGSGEIGECAAPELAQTGWNDNYPVVSITPRAFTYNGRTAIPTLTATFTDQNGNTTTVAGGGTSGNGYSENYESAASVSGWVSPGAAMSIGSGDGTYGRYLFIDTQRTNTRYAYTKPSGVNVAGWSEYTIEFDLAMKSGNTDGVEFCVMSKNGVMPTNNWDNYAAINANRNMLFDLTAGKNSTSFTINGNSGTTTLGSGTWYHYKLTVNQSAGTVRWSISNGSSGTYSLPSGSSSVFDGFYIVAGRYYSTFKLDNIKVSKNSSAQTIFTQNYENGTGLSDWHALDAGNMTIVSGDGTYGKYFRYANSGRTRYAYTTVNLDYSSAKVYTVEFDAALGYSSRYDETVELCVMSKGGSLPGNWNQWDHYSYKNGGANYLFELENGGKSSTIYTVNQSGKTTNLANGGWYHYKLTVNRQTGVVDYSISNGTAGSYTLPAGTSSEFYGFYHISPRSDSSLKLDNVKVTITEEADMGGALSSFTFSQPGTLSVTASYPGCLPASATFCFDGSSNVKELNDFAEEEESDVFATEISNVRQEDPVLNDVWYNLSGQRVDKPTKGIFINGNGKKFIFR